MDPTLLEINDFELRWSSKDGFRREPGWALATEPVLLGSQALAQARLQPRFIKSQFWQQLSTDTMPGATAAIRHHADLAYLQLQAIHAAASGETYVVCMPSHYDRAQLSLLLGLTEAANLPVKALVDPGVLLARQTGTTAPTVLYLDIDLHAVTLTVIGNADQISRQKALSPHSKGLLTLIDRLANLCAAKLIQQSRFDPLDQAITEQALFEQLIVLDSGYEHLGSRDIRLQLDETYYEVSLNESEQRNVIIDMLPDIVTAIRSEALSTAELLISHRIAMLPGLEDAIGLIPNIKITKLESSALLDAFNGFSEELMGRPERHQLLYSLPRLHRQGEDPGQSEVTSRAVSHVLQRGIATALTAYCNQPLAALSIQQNENHCWQLIPGHAALSLNDRVLTQPVVLQIGDRVTFQNETFEFIAVR